jgi:molybdate transport system ATP-binding protein
VRHDAADGLSELAVGGGRLWVPRIEAAPGAVLRVRVRARDVMLALRPPEAISALNVLPVTVTEIGDAEGAIVEVGLDCGGDRLRARITGRSLRALGLAPGAAAWAVLKSVAVGRRDIAPAAESGGIHSDR